MALIVVPVGLNSILRRCWTHTSLAGAMTETLAPLLIVNPTGCSPSTTTTRPDIVFEGSDDDQEPGANMRFRIPGAGRPRAAWNIPYQPRLDWQLWFAAYGSAAQHRWIETLAAPPARRQPARPCALRGEPVQRRPPRYVRALLYDYRFADPRSPEAHGQWWVRRLDGNYYPPTSLADIQRAAPRWAPRRRSRSHETKP